MLRDTDIVKIPFEINGEKRYLRYNMNSRLYLEYTLENPDVLQKNPKFWTFDETIHMLRALLMDSYYTENKEFIDARDFMKVRPHLSEIGRYLDENDMDNLVHTIVSGIVSFFPESPIGLKDSQNPHKAM